MFAKEGKLVNLRVITLSALALAGGIFFAYLSFLHGKWISLLIIAFLALFSLFTIFIKGKIKSVARIASLILLISFLIGSGLGWLPLHKAKTLFYHGEYGQFEGQIYDLTYTDNGAYLYFEKCVLSGNDLKSKALLFLPSEQFESKIDLGAVASFDCKIVNRFKAGDSSTEIFLGVYYELSEVKNLKIIDFGGNFFDLGYLKARTFIKTNLSKESMPMALALLLGDSSYYHYETLQNYRFAGIAHIFAISGLHIGIVVTIFSYVAKIFKLKRKIRPFFILIPALIYCGICGFRPSSLRAFVMASVTILANHTGFKKDNLSSCSIAGIILLCIKPYWLFDYGFRLSFVAVISIFALAPLFERHSKPFKSLASTLSITLSAALGTTPILFKMSGYISIITIFANLLLVPVAVFLYITTFVSFLLSAILSVVINNAGVIMGISDYLLKSVDFLIGKIDFSPFIINGSLGALEIIWYLGIICMSDYLNISGKQKFLTGTLAMGLSIVLATII